MKALLAAVMAILVVGAGCGKRDDSEAGTGTAARAPRVDLHVTAMHGNAEAVRGHVEAGTDLNKKDAYGSTPLVVAATFGKADAARALIEGGADTSITNNEGATPLHVAAFLCHTEIVQALLDAGADKNARDRAGSTALDSVACPFEMVKGVYDQIGKSLAPLGLRMDYERIRQVRPQIAEMLR